MADQSSDQASAPLLSIAGARATLRFNRPREHNRIDPSDLPVLAAQLQQVAHSSAVDVLVITGTGDKTFSSGYTLEALVNLQAEPHGVTWDGLMDQIEDLPVPTIAAMNGSIYGGATDIALACDFRVGVTGSRFVMPATKIGLHYYPGAMRRYVERLGLPAAKRLFLLGRPTPCEQMQQLGFFDALVAPNELHHEVDAMVQTLIDSPREVVRSMKRHLNLIARGQMDAPAIHAAYVASQRSDNLREGLAALREKRAPKFR